MPEVAITGTEEEKKTFYEVFKHYQMSREDLDSRIPQFNKNDALFRSHIEQSGWPYRAQVFDPRVFTAIYEKTARLLANKPRGRVVPREGGDTLRAKIINELLSFQWDDNERADGLSMIAKWAQMDLNARKYGASFGLSTWHWRRQVVRLTTDEEKEQKGKAKIYFDGPNFRPLNNRDCLANPSYTTIKHWFQHREYVTLEELQNTNDAARSKPIYKNLDILRQALRTEAQVGGDQRATNYVSKNLAIKGLTDYLGQDELYKTVEIVTEYRQDRWITFAPRHGVILRDIANPYDHGQIPIVQLKYYPVDEDLYGLSEIEPIEKIQRAINALVCQYLDAVNMSLYAPLKIRAVGGAVQMHTLQFGPGAKWLMNDPATDVVTHDQQPTGVSEFGSTYRFLVGAMQEALGETSAGVSNLDPGANKKTATEVKDLAVSRSARDNFNQIFLGEAMKKQFMFWLTMDQQLFFKNMQDKVKIMHIVGKDAISYFKGEGLDAMTVNDQNMEQFAQNELMPPEEKINMQMSDFEEPLYPVQTDMGMEPKLEMEASGQMGKLYLEPGDLSGAYDFILDVGSMDTISNQIEVRAKQTAFEQVTQGGVGMLIAQEGKRVKIADMAVDYWEDIGFKNADQYIENQPGGGVYGQQAIQGGGVGPQAVPPGMANGAVGGMAAGVQAVPGGQAPGVIPGPGQV